MEKSTGHTFAPSSDKKGQADCHEQYPTQGFGIPTKAAKSALLTERLWNSIFL